jgi:hypothetical protein
MFLVGWISDSFQEILVSGGYPTVVGQTLKLAGHADRVGNPRFGRQHFLNGDRMLPTVAKVVGRHGLRTDVTQNPK